MRDLILEKVGDAAELLGVPRERVMVKSLKDNITLPRPRLELDFLGETHTRTGRLHGGSKGADGKPEFRKELYEVTLPVAVQVLADDEDWLKEFCWRLTAALPRGFEDGRGNYVKLTARLGEWEGFERRRVGEAVIEPLARRGYLLHVNAEWRISVEEKVIFVDKVAFEGFKTKIGGKNYGEE